MNEAHKEADETHDGETDSRRGRYLHEFCETRIKPGTHRHKELEGRTLRPSDRARSKYRLDPGRPLVCDVAVSCRERFLSRTLSIWLVASPNKANGIDGETV